MKFQKLLPILVGLACLGYLISLPFRPMKSTSAYDWRTAGMIPVLADGRVKPTDTFARNSLMSISGRQSYPVKAVDADGKERESMEPAVRWYYEMISTPRAANTRPVFRIDHPDIVAMLKVSDPKRTRFSADEIGPALNEILKQADMARQVRASERDPFQRQILDLESRIFLYGSILQGSAPFSVAPLGAGEEWRSLAEAVGSPHPSVLAQQAMLTSMKDGKADAFNTEAARYLGLLEGTLPTDTHRAELEQMKNRAEPFYQTSVLYVFAFILAALGLLMANVPNSTWPTTLARTALAVILVAFVMHTIGIGTRIYLQGRPPVTNLYSSAIFIGWAAIPIALAAEWFLRLGLGNVVASLIGFATLVVAHNLDDGGDTMEMMQAVLDSNFWLATHVVVITIGYSATYLAGFIAAAYVVLGLFTRSLGPGAMKSLPKMIYGVVCFATLTSFVGTVLGGIWADQSWGRFWGWDPKENGAALIVFINLIILHARWGGMIRDRGLAALAIFGNIVTSWSWFGTNMLGVGLHSYGFIASAAFWLTAFCLSQLGLMMLALVPHRYWRSVRAPAPAPESGVREPQPSPAS